MAACAHCGQVLLNVRWAVPTVAVLGSAVNLAVPKAYPLVWASAISTAVLVVMVCMTWIVMIFGKPRHSSRAKWMLQWLRGSDKPPKNG
ncbi:hypothetical protein Aph01nite_59040 [Acrocarpospora phusangensis]|uniref:Uncharacterized protein n=1 Tax=Acrocarpospora phusangensis TaxID=1070424 RepID=A0A919QGQ2_9ACTN|nr:hypothetical protein Aph01nite_59040 [Acrocarpospora phusangensis]